MRGHAQQDFALAQGLAHQPEGALLEIAQAAWISLLEARGGAGSRGRSSRPKARASRGGGIGGQPGSVDAAAMMAMSKVGHLPADWLVFG